MAIHVTLNCVTIGRKPYQASGWIRCI